MCYSEWKKTCYSILLQAIKFLNWFLRFKIQKIRFHSFTSSTWICLDLIRNSWEDWKSNIAKLTQHIEVTVKFEKIHQGLSEMKLFQVVLKKFAILGIHPSHQSNQRLSLNKKELFGFLSIGSLIFSQTMYGFYEANGFMEYMDCICATSATMLVFVCLATMVIRKTKLFEMLDYMERVIEASKAIFNLLFLNVISFWNLNCHIL